MFYAMDNDIKTKCRICLCLENNCMSLFEIQDAQLCSSTILDNITLIANVKIEPNDGLPSTICGECLSELDSAIKFKEKCERSDKYLHLMEDEKVKCDMSPIAAELPIPIELVKKEETSDDDIHYEVEYYDGDESDIEVKPKLDETDTTLPAGVKPEQKLVESDATEATSVTQAPLIKKSKAIDLKLECHDCGGSFKSKCKLRVHWKKVHMFEKLICNFCKKSFKSFVTYHKHLKRRPKNCILASKAQIEGIGKYRVFKCRHCSFQTNKSCQLEFHFNIHTGNRPFVCKLCSKCFTLQSVLDSHMECVHKIIKKVITCQYCGVVVMGRDKIRRHMEKHTRIPIQCDICKKMYKSKEILINHLKIHSGVKAYTCEKCAASFYTFAALATHRRIKHTIQKKYFTCDFCGYKLLNKTAMMKHEIKHTNSNLGCGVCGRFYPDAEELASHQRVHTKEASLCLECNRIFSSESTLRRHKIQTHKHKKNSAKQTPKIKKKKVVKNVKDKKVIVELIPPSQ